MNNQEIKFRCWDEIKKQMYYHNHLILEWSESHIVVNKKQRQSYDIYKVENPILMQFTGLKDKNGKPIFESDIIQGDEKQSNIVFWFAEKGMWALDQKDVPYDSLAEFNEEMEVIGNIYENGDLFK